VKKFKKLLVIVMAVVCLGAIAGGVLAATGAVEISVTFRDITIEKDGKMIDGSEAFIYEGKIYMPLRTMADAFGSVAIWHDDTGSVIIVPKSSVSDKKAG